MRRSVCWLAPKFVQKRWNNKDTTNNYNRSLYTRAHLEANTIQAKSLHDMTHFEDEMPMGRRNSDLAGLVSSEGGRSPGLYKSWAGDDLVDQAASAISKSKNNLPDKLQLDVLSLLVPTNHRLLVNLQEDAKKGVLKRTHPRKLSLNIIHEVVKGIANEPRQQRILLAYVLHIVAPHMHPQDALRLFQFLSGNFEHTTTDHLAIIIAASDAKMSADYAEKALKVIKEETAFAGGKLPLVLAPLYLKCLKVLSHNTNRKVDWENALKFVMTAPVDKFEGRVWKSLMSTVGGNRGAPFTVIQSIVDSAVDSNEANLRDRDVWAGYLAAAPWAHSLELLNVNMPEYKVKPDLGAYTAILSSIAKENGPWQEALKVLTTVANTGNTLEVPTDDRRTKILSSVAVKALRKVVKSSKCTEDVQLEFLLQTKKVPCLFDAWRKLTKRE